MRHLVESSSPPPHILSMTRSRSKLKQEIAVEITSGLSRWFHWNAVGQNLRSKFNPESDPDPDLLEEWSSPRLWKWDALSGRGSRECGRVFQCDYFTGLDCSSKQKTEHHTHTHTEHCWRILCSDWSLRCWLMFHISSSDRSAGLSLL